MTTTLGWVPFTSRVVEVGDRVRVDGDLEGTVEAFSVERQIIYREPFQRDLVHVQLDDGRRWQVYVTRLEIEARP